VQIFSEQISVDLPEGSLIFELYILQKKKKIWTFCSTWTHFLVWALWKISKL